jgi:hypothetical protein
MKKSFLILSFSFLILCSSCATIVCGSKQTVKFSSNPANAIISINNSVVGVTPYETKLDRKVKEHHIVFKLDGYQPFETKLTRKFNAWYIGNLAIGGLVGLIIDPITGAIYKLSPKEVKAEMAKGVTFKNEKNQMFIAVALDIDPNWEKIDQLEKM